MVGCGVGSWSRVQISVWARLVISDRAKSRDFGRLGHVAMSTCCEKKSKLRQILFLNASLPKAIDPDFYKSTFSVEASTRLRVLFNACARS